jgi:hypothetical protein
LFEEDTSNDKKIESVEQKLDLLNNRMELFSKKSALGLSNEKFLIRSSLGLKNGLNQLKSSTNQQSKSSLNDSITSLLNVRNLIPLESQSSSTSKNESILKKPLGLSDQVKNMPDSMLKMGVNIPHPPQSARPASSPARKLRLTSVIKETRATKQSETNEQNLKDLTKSIKNVNCLNNNEECNQEEGLISNVDNKTLFEQQDFLNKARLVENSSSVSLIVGEERSKKDQIQEENKRKAINALKIRNSNDINQSNIKNHEFLKLPMLSGPLGLVACETLHDINDTESAGDSLIFSFSAKPKPVEMVSDDANNKPNSSSMKKQEYINANKAYNHLKYLPITSNRSDEKQNKLQEDIKPSEEDKNNTTRMANSDEKQKPCFTRTKKAHLSINTDKENINVNYSNLANESTDEMESKKIANLVKQKSNEITLNCENNCENPEALIDSLEAHVLHAMKFEMEAINRIHESKDGKPPRHLKSIQSKADLTVNEKLTNHNRSNHNREKLNLAANEEKICKSPDVDYIENIQREASGIQTPLSDENNQTASEKYNFDAVMTSSIEETSTSISKKTVSYLLCYFFKLSCAF